MTSAASSPARSDARSQCIRSRSLAETSSAGTAAAAAGASRPSAQQSNGDGDGHGDGEKDDEEPEYEIAGIVSHETGLYAPNEMAYLVQWVGYGTEYDSWIREEDAENAADMLADYWKRQKRPAMSILSISKTAREVWNQTIKEAHAASQASGTEKRRRSPRAALLAANDAASSATPTPAKNKSKRQRDAAAGGRGGVDDDDDDDDDDDIDITLLSPEEREGVLIKRARKRYKHMADWENVVDFIETVARNEQGRLVAAVRFVDGGRFTFETPIVNRRCPQKMLALYESRLRWTRPRKDLPPVPDAVPSPPPVAAIPAGSQGAGEGATGESSVGESSSSTAEATANGASTSHGATQVDGFAGAAMASGEAAEDAEDQRMQPQSQAESQGQTQPRPMTQTQDDAETGESEMRV